MGALGDVATTVEVTPNCGLVMIQLVTAATVDDGDTITVDLTQYGCSKIHGITGFSETTTGQVVAIEDPTTSVSSGTLTITVGGSTDNEVRTFIIYAY